MPSPLKKDPYCVRGIVIVIIIVISIPIIYVSWTLTGGDPQGDWVLVTHVTDGDTIGVGRGWRYEKVRLIGVDTPETVHPTKPVEPFGPEASDFTKRKLKGQRVQLEFEPANHYDRYNRLLAYVFLSDRTLFNADLIKGGYARVFGRYRFVYYKEFKQYELKAREAGLGIWSRK